MRLIPLIAALSLCAAPAFADDDDEPKFGMAGLLSATNSEDLPPILLSAGQPLADAPLRLKSGTYYEIEIEADGSQELALEGSGFFRAIWIDEIVIEGLEIRPLGLDSVEFDEAGTMEIGFVAIKPGRYELRVPQSRGDLQRLEITIE
ncbi:hypothetical protein [Pseudoprimorskyibacter insulae]|uniref:MSP domain-containing protein n=1 Tax=Pseudoprimorskyibacter insulae TaxID=1695997 RepID=A0A2R8B099_9RHOB|nr:hypothetical protein [Pseudoprimorskyibacter insulae]SPF81698.1 hypothetical protein PRI8871_03523 [Pseudoprimorskyibacter insulae]